MKVPLLLAEDSRSDFLKQPKEVNWAAITWDTGTTKRGRSLLDFTIAYALKMKNKKL